MKKFKESYVLKSKVFKIQYRKKRWILTTQYFVLKTPDHEIPESPEYVAAILRVELNSWTVFNHSLNLTEEVLSWTWCLDSISAYCDVAEMYVDMKNNEIFSENFLAPTGALEMLNEMAPLMVHSHTFVWA